MTFPSRWGGGEGERGVPVFHRAEERGDEAYGEASQAGSEVRYRQRGKLGAADESR